MSDSFTTSSLAAAIDLAQTKPPSESNYLIQLENRVAKLLAAFPQLLAPFRAFVKARRKTWPSNVTDASWAAALECARTLATEIRALGDITLQLCERVTSMGICSRALVPATSRCPHDGNPDWHLA